MRVVPVGARILITNTCDQIFDFLFFFFFCASTRGTEERRTSVLGATFKFSTDAEWEPGWKCTFLFSYAFFTVKTDYKISFPDVFSVEGKTITTKAIFFLFSFFFSESRTCCHRNVYVQKWKGNFASIVWI